MRLQSSSLASDSASDSVPGCERRWADRWWGIPLPRYDTGEARRPLDDNSRALIIQEELEAEHGGRSSKAPQSNWAGDSLPVV